MEKFRGIGGLHGEARMSLGAELDANNDGKMCLEMADLAIINFINGSRKMMMKIFYPIKSSYFDFGG
jgi:hypothetical protein